MELIFIYNADSGAINKLIDFTHKIISPSTYNCQLCSITYGSFAMKHQWKHFLEIIPHKKIFLYKNEAQKLGVVLPKELPSILLKNNKKEIKELVSAADMIQFQSVNELILLLQKRITDYA